MVKKRVARVITIKNLRYTPGISPEVNTYNLVTVQCCEIPIILARLGITSSLLDYLAFGLNTAFIQSLASFD